MEDSNQLFLKRKAPILALPKWAHSKPTALNCVAKEPAPVFPGFFPTGKKAVGHGGFEPPSRARSLFLQKRTDGLSQKARRTFSQAF